MDNIEKDLVLYTWGAAGEAKTCFSSVGEMYGVLEDLHGAEGLSTVWWLEDSANKNIKLYTTENGVVRVAGRARRVGSTERGSVRGPDSGGADSVVPNPENSR